MSGDEDLCAVSPDDGTDDGSVTVLEDGAASVPELLELAEIPEKTEGKKVSFTARFGGVTVQVRSPGADTSVMIGDGMMTVWADGGYVEISAGKE